jgi:hypothetical protein
MNGPVFTLAFTPAPGRNNAVEFGERTRLACSLSRLGEDLNSLTLDTK